ncbi:MAG TPA: diaminopimelate decarboxylase [Vicinamibacterales bacterium]|nr:diaminopimelate decarboxylase [Vicinamibacterales bacterium]
MAGFWSDQRGLLCDDVPLAEIAAEVGTPVHVYSAPLIRERFRALDSAFAGRSHRLHYAIKANSTTAVVRELRSLGARADANSGGEIEVALRAGFTPDQIVFTGVGKTRGELERAVDLGLAAINAESPGEVDRIAAIAHAKGTVANVAVRVNPDVVAGAHPHISTGTASTKFGMSIPDAAAMLRDMARRPVLRIAGLHVHIGSQITDAGPFAAAVQAIADLARVVGTEGIRMRHLDIGGGLGVAYQPGEKVLDVEAYAAAVIGAVGDTDLELVLEPGRWIVGPAGALLTQVVDLKTRARGSFPGDTEEMTPGLFVIVDAGMTELIRPAFYGAYHGIEPVAPRAGAPIRADVVGPICETSDTLGRDRELPPVEVGDLMVVRDTGAYGAVMASNYNRRPAAAEVMVDGGTWRVVRRRQTIDDMLQWDE